MIESRFVYHHGVAIHVLDSLQDADPCMLPLIISPGLSETAEEYVDVMNALHPRRCIVLSYRGRGRSDTPKQGYDLADHVADLQAVIQESKVPACHLMGHSRGASYALGYANKQHEHIQSLILEEYPAEHKQMPDDWAEAYIHNYLIPTQREACIRSEAVRGIQRESTQIPLDKKLDLPVLILRGMQESSLLTDEHIRQFKSLYPNLETRSYHQSGHDIRRTENDKMISDIQFFLATVEKQRSQRT